MQFIPVHGGLYALVDDEDFGLASAYRWHLSSDGYPKTNAGVTGNKTTLYLHTLLSPAPKGYVTDHENTIRLDCRRLNLRSIPKKFNVYNRRVQRNSNSGLKGVTKSKDRGKWRAYIGYQGQQIQLGEYDSADEAAYVYDQAAKQLFGGLARTNLLH